MVTAIKDNPYSIAYIGTSYQNAIEKDGLGIAILKNRADSFVLPNARTAKAAAAQMVPKTPKDGRINLSGGHAGHFMQEVHFVALPAPLVKLS